MVCLVVAFLAAQFGAWVRLRWYEVEFGDGGMSARLSDGSAFVSDYTGLGVYEKAVDRNSDGQTDLWQLLVNEGSVLELRYEIYDESNKDEKTYRAHMGTDPNRMSVQWYPLNSEAGAAEGTVVELTDSTRTGYSIVYVDYNQDGRLDTLIEYQEDTEQRMQIRMDWDWLTAREIDGGFEAKTGEGAFRPVEFLEGQWRFRE